MRIAKNSWPAFLTSATAAKCCVAVVLLQTLAACSWLPPVPGMDRITGEEGIFRDRQGEYLQAVTIPRTKIPDDMDSFIIDDLLFIPELPAEAGEPFLNAPRPLPLEGRSDREVVIQRMENRSWIVVDVSPNQVWPRIRDYWRQADIAVAFEDPTDGIMDTGWFVDKGNVLTKEKIRVTVEPGFQNNSAEIRLLHQSVPQALAVFDQVNWPAASVDPDMEFKQLNDLSTYLADVADLYQASTVSFLAGNISSQGRAEIVPAADGNELLRLQADYNRSWAAVGRALNRSGVEIISQDVALGLYEVTYRPGSENETQEEPGLLKKIFTLNGVFSKSASSGSFPLQVRLQETAPVVEVKVNSEGSTSEEVKAAEQALLHLIRNTIA